MYNSLPTSSPLVEKELGQEHQNIHVECNLILHLTNGVERNKKKLDDYRNCIKKIRILHLSEYFSCDFLTWKTDSICRGLDN